MSLVIALNEIGREDRKRVGGKAFRLAAMGRSGMVVPPALCISGEAYHEYIRSTGLEARIHFELNRKAFEQMRWEEIWDGALRIRNLFINTPLPDTLRSRLEGTVCKQFGGVPVAVRSSGEEEDSSSHSFAGLHESYVNVLGTRAILAHIKLVWASLWSDRALLYRKELGLDMSSSAMPVLVQELCAGEVSGVAFSRGPGGEDHVVIEAVYGLNQGLVDGTVEPDRWILDRTPGGRLEHRAPETRRSLVPAPEGVELIDLDPKKSKKPPLGPNEVTRVHGLALQAETLFGDPQDVEWTLKSETLLALQSRPITTLKQQEDSNDQRPWYLSLRRSFENLKALRKTIEGEVLPAMDREAAILSKERLNDLSDSDLAMALEDRHRIYHKWRDVYWRDCIPFAHGMRLFGEVYNDKVNPVDPYEFLDLLGTSKLAGLERNRRLEAMAEAVRNNPGLEARLREQGAEQLGPELADQVEEFLSEFGSFSRPDAGGFQGELGRANVINLVLELAGQCPSTTALEKKDTSAMKLKFLAAFEGEQRAYAEELLDLGRASYRLRDDDNIYLARVERQLHRSLDEGQKRLIARGLEKAALLEREEVIRGLRDPEYAPKQKTLEETSKVPRDEHFKARQLVGQPAGPGVARARARVIDDPESIFQFKAGEVLVCDAVDPGMTFVVPLAAGIVERRGGMLIHGAIIAREYGLPCVTGVPDATSMIRSGDRVTVDGYLGIVIVG